MNNSANMILFRKEKMSKAKTKPTRTPTPTKKPTKKTWNAP